jgi:cell division protein FtsX
MTTTATIGVPPEAQFQGAFTVYNVMTLIVCIFVFVVGWVIAWVRRGLRSEPV